MQSAKDEKNDQRGKHCKNCLVMLRKMLIQTLEVEKIFKDTHPMENHSLSDDTHPIKMIK